MGEMVDSRCVYHKVLQWYTYNITYQYDIAVESTWQMLTKTVVRCIRCEGCVYVYLSAAYGFIAMALWHSDVPIMLVMWHAFATTANRGNKKRNTDDYWTDTCHYTSASASLWTALMFADEQILGPYTRTHHIWSACGRTRRDLINRIISWRPTARRLSQRFHPISHIIKSLCEASRSG